VPLPPFTSIFCLRLLTSLSCQIQRCFVAWRLHVYRERSLLLKLRQLLDRDVPPGLNPNDQLDDLESPPQMLDEATWHACTRDGMVTRPVLLLQAVLRGGCHPSLRAAVWPYLLNIYHYDITADEKETVAQEAIYMYAEACDAAAKLQCGAPDSLALTDLAFALQVCFRLCVCVCVCVWCVCVSCVCVVCVVCVDACWSVSFVELFFGFECHSALMHLL
jgi:hypothetical protein